MAISIRPQPIECPECNYQGKSLIKKSDFGLLILFLLLLVASFFLLFWPLFILSLVILCWLLVKRSNKVCPNCRFEIPIQK